MVSVSQIRLIIKRQAQKGCSDHGCIFKRQESGVGTNGGCKCDYHCAHEIMDALRNESNKDKELPEGE